jgi:oxygen-dependent protoporphyrinogen oxidase
VSKITIIGGGISGLTLAWWLHKAGRDVTVLEAGAEVGGTMKTVRDGEWLIEQGPNSTLATTPLFETLVNDLGISNEVLQAQSTSKKRYIVKNGRLHCLPMSPFSFFGTELWSAGAKFRLLKEPLIERAEKEETLAEFVTRRLGQEFLDYAINPFVAGVYAGDPATLSVRDAFPKLYALEKEYGSLIMGAIKKRRNGDGSVAKNKASMFSYREGMQTLPLALYRALSDQAQLNYEVKSISKNTNGQFTINGTQKGLDHEIVTDAVVMAVPSFVASKLVRSLSPEASDALDEIKYAPVAEVFLGYKSEVSALQPDGFGFLVPEKEKRSILGAIWSSSIFERRAPAGHHAFTVFIGGARQPQSVDESDDTLVSLALSDLKLLMNQQESPVYKRVIKWPKAIPQYRIGHGRIIERLLETENKLPGLFFTGNYRGGIAVGDCVIQSRKLADQILNANHGDTKKL